MPLMNPEDNILPSEDSGLSSPLIFAELFLSDRGLRLLKVYLICDGLKGGLEALRVFGQKLLWGFSVAAALSLACAGQVRAQAEAPKLTLTIAIEGQQYCVNSPAMTTEQLRLRLRFTNAGNQKLILYRGDDLFYQAKIRPAQSALQPKPYEIAVLNARYLEQENEPIEQPSPGRLFIILQPGASYEMETTFGLGVVPQDARRDRHAVVEGEHTLYLIVSTWYRTRALAEKLRQRWQRKGYLWADPVVSNALTFRAERPPSAQPCR